MNILKQAQDIRHFGFGIFLPILLMMLVGCGGSGNSGAAANTGGTGGSTGSTTQSGIKIGNGTGASFVEGTLNIAVTNLSAGGSTSVTVNLVDSSNNPYATDTKINFSSTCSGLGFATLDAEVTTSNGTAIANYAATGCSSTDTITATASVEGTTISATGTLTVAPANIGSIQFVSATPSTIAIAGTGGANLNETSTLVFKVVDEVGGPVSGQTVNFALDTTVGGIFLLPSNPSSAETSLQGLVQVVVNSGTVHTAVKVSASTTDSVSGNTIQTQSDALVVSTGVPDQDSFSLSFDTFNPEAWRIDGVGVTVTARLADHFNNPVPDGTAVAFTTEGGSIEAACTTSGGACDVQWKSQSPRPSDGRVTILATAIGSESFLDLNGNGIYDSVDDTRGVAFDAGNPVADLPEAYRDDNESGTYDQATEEFLDFNVNGSRDTFDNLYNGVLCDPSTNVNCSSTRSVHVRQSGVIIMADEAFTVTITPAVINVTPNVNTPVTISIMDARGQVPPKGSIISSYLDNGDFAGTNAPKIMPSTNQPGPYVYTIELTTKDIILNDSGVLQVTVTTPSGGVSTATAIVND